MLIHLLGNVSVFSDPPHSRVLLILTELWDGRKFILELLPLLFCYLCTKEP